MVSRTPLERLKTPELPPTKLEVERWSAAGAEVELWDDRYLIRQDRVPVQFLRSRCRTLKQGKGLDVVLVDYLQLRGGGRGEKRYLAVGDISTQLLDLARELDVAVIALSQLNREAESREPSMADIRESGNMHEQDARNIFLLDRPGCRGEDLEDGRVALPCDLGVRVGKYSEGRALGRVVMHYNLDCQIIEPLQDAIECSECRHRGG